MNDIDLLMQRVEEINLKTADELTSNDIATIIAYHRHNRSRLIAGEKPKKPSVDLSGILAGIKAKSATAQPAESTTKRRQWGK